MGNNADLDDDNDGFLDDVDQFPLDASEQLDSDNDGLGNNADPDNDNDGVADEYDAYPNDPSFVRAAVTNLADNGAAQFTVYGKLLNESCGVDISSAGDMNNDGNADFVIGCNHDSNPDTYNGPNAYLIFGPLEAGSIELSQLDGSNGVVLHKAVMIPENVENPAGYEANNYGNSIAGGMDVNGDGIDDLLISEINSSLSNNIYIVFGRTTPWPALINTSVLDDSDGTILKVEIYDNQTLAPLIISRSINNAVLSPDLNQDGIAEIIVTTSETRSKFDGSTSRGTAFVIYGQQQWTTNTTVTPASLNGDNGFTIYGRTTTKNGTSPSSNSFTKVASGKDFNGDDILDIALLDPGVVNFDAESNSYNDTGEAYILSSNTAINGLINLNDPDYEPLLTIAGKHNSRNNPLSDMQLASDINQDGNDDLLLGQPGARETFVVFGGPYANTRINVTELDGANGFTITSNTCNGNSNSGLGFSIADIGDTNQDGFSDFAVTDFYCHKYYVIEGGRKQWPSLLTLSNSNLNASVTGEAGIGFTPGYYSYYGLSLGSKVSFIGDANNDGVSDLLVSSSNQSNPEQPEKNAVGSTTVIFSCLDNCSVIGTDSDNDGTPDLSDAFPQNPLEALDSDGDGIGNNADLDDDNDGVDDSEDIFPYNPDEQSDSDMDGIGDNADI
jgi:hypothetical protein